MKTTPNAPRDDARHCFVCGPDNPIGLRIRFRLDGGHCRGEFTSRDEHVGFDAVTHGGIVFSVLDDAMANWFFLQGARGFTAKAEIRFRAPMPLGATAAIDCELVRRRGRLVELAARAQDAAADTVFAEAQASFMLDDPQQLPDS
ncbi:MAG: PaaI family thioesterase [Gammaproteobacteria bacterium]